MKTVNISKCANNLSPIKLLVQLKKKQKENERKTTEKKKEKKKNQFDTSVRRSRVFANVLKKPK